MSSNYDKPFKEVLSKSLFGLRDYNLVLVVYTFSIGVLSLATPITVQSLVNTFALSTDVQPLFNLSFILLGLLIIFGIIKSFQYITVELMQQKVIAQLSAMVSKKVIFGPRSESFF
jgi:ABC-type bacteriocin/lantibiotic exporter with double-glycine peptidase domain